MSQMPFIIARQSLRALSKQPTILVFATLFVGLVLISAYLGWSATSTVNAIYIDAVNYLSAAGQPIPTNPVNDISPLGLLRNMTIYISLIGALAAIVVGYQLIATDRKAGVLPLIGSRIGHSRAYLIGKLIALVLLLVTVIALAGLIAAATLVLLPTAQISTVQWFQLLGFLGTALIYLLFFGLISLAASALYRVESVALLVPVTLWLTLTFVFPELSSNIHPTAAINPVSSLAGVPDSGFFHLTHVLLGPISLAEHFKSLGAWLLEYRTEASVFPLSDLLSLFFATCLAGLAAFIGLTRINLAKGEFNV